MNYERVKKDSQIALDGITIDIERRDGSPCTVNLTDSKGAVLRIAMESYSMNLYIPAAQKMVEKWKLHGTVLGMPVELICDDEYSAKEMKTKYERGVNQEDDAALTINEVKIPEES